MSRTGPIAASLHKAVMSLAEYLGRKGGEERKRGREEKGERKGGGEEPLRSNVGR